ncbi:MAG: serine/threonine protein kinase [Archangium sp.]|nr:serine/threonine protein kinase [Archangium sp.]
MDTSTPKIITWAAGQHVAQYTLVKPIGSGGMAEVWLAYAEGAYGFRKPIALKRMNTELAKDRTFVDMFLDEARLVSRLTHPGIGQVLELGEQTGSVFVAMEYLAGETIFSMMKSAAQKQVPVPLGIAVKMVIDAADALHYAHVRTDDAGTPMNVVHRDISPQNIMVTYEGIVKLLDFGIAKATQRSVHTLAGQVKGKLSYMAPEQARGEDIDARADLFALGIVLFEMVTGTRLFNSRSSDWELMQAVAGSEEALPRANDRNPAVPEALTRVIAKAMERKADLRYATVEDFRNALNQWLSATHPSPPNAQKVSALMQQLFPEQIATQKAVMAQLAAGAKRRDSSISGPSLPAAPAPSVPTPTPRSISATRTSAQLKAKQKQQPSVAMVLVGFLAVGGLVGAAVVALGSRTRSTQPPPPVQVDPQLKAQTEEAARLAAEARAAAERIAADKAAAEQAAAAKAAAEKAAAEKAAAEKAAADKANAAAAAAADRERNRKRSGKLTLKTEPWTQVYLKGELLGETPLVEKTLPAGPQLLKLVNEEKEISTTIQVDIVADKTVIKSLRF